MDAAASVSGGGLTIPISGVSLLLTVTWSTVPAHPAALGRATQR